MVKKQKDYNNWLNTSFHTSFLFTKMIHNKYIPSVNRDNKWSTNYQIQVIGSRWIHRPEFENSAWALGLGSTLINKWCVESVKFFTVTQKK